MEGNLAEISCNQLSTRWHGSQIASPVSIAIKKLIIGILTSPLYTNRNLSTQINSYFVALLHSVPVFQSLFSVEMLIF